MLGTIGLDETHESAYRILMTVGAADVPDLARRLTLGEHDTERALRRLERHGLAARSSARPGRWVAAPPGVALGTLLTRQRHDPIDVVIGADAVAQRCRQLRLGAGEIRALITGGPVTVAVTGTADYGTEERAAGRGVRHRLVLERSVLARPHGVTGLSAALGREERVRVADRLPAELLIVDETLAMVPLASPTAEPTALVVHASGLLELLSGLFETIWREALPVRLGASGVTEQRPDGPDGTDLEVLCLLLAGLTDASVAKQLDLGLRTVQRRVKRLMELTGATTRLQLGWHAHERGWVTRGGRDDLGAPGAPAP